MSIDLRDPWLVAVWPGMGSVAAGAGSYLVEQLGATLLEELPLQGFFDVEKVKVRRGLARPARLPRSLLYGARNELGRDLLIFVGEAQPNQRGWDLCVQLLEAAARYGVSRVITFAAMATATHPASASRVFGVGNQSVIVDELRATRGVALLSEGEITGLNGVLLACAAERNMPGICLLGELPVFPMAAPNPKASLAVLRVFTDLARLTIDFAELGRHARAVEQKLSEVLERMTRAAQELGRAAGQERAEPEDELGFTLPSFAGDSDSDSESEGEGDKGKADDVEGFASNMAEALDDVFGKAGLAGKPKPASQGLKAEDLGRIESMFAAAAANRDLALPLKAELDRLGVFKQYEDRFLDLFKQAD
ncbi:MAG: PAC2 family protein [Planctomycetota bacterium]|jgi:proteasome assembly chaperone (PAC2) family protein